jgi:hypothetical protein
MARLMPGRRGHGLRPGRRAAAVLGLACSVALASSAAALGATQSVVATKARSVTVSVDPGGSAAKKKKKKKKKAAATATTQSSPVAFGSATAPTGSAACTGSTHATGGGYAISPSFTPPATGLRSAHIASNPVGAGAWSSQAAAFSNPIASGLLTTFVRCESNALGKLALTGSSSVTLAPGSGQNLIFNCAPGTHVLTGGFSGTSFGDFANPNTGYRTIVLQNRRTGPGQWTVTGYNNPQAGVTATLTGYAVCERDAKGRTISEASAFAPLTENARGAADATCGGKTHVVSGGFLVSPTGPGQVPGVGIDEMQPVGNKGWHVGLHDFVNVELPLGSSLTGYAYCAPDALPKKKKKRKK